MPPRSLNSETSPVFDSHRKLRPRSSPPTSFTGSNGGCAIDWEETDSEYAFFLRHLRVDGNSYVAEIPVRGCRPRPPLRIKYEKVRESSFPALQKQHQRRRRYPADEAKKGCERRCSPVESFSKCDVQDSSIDNDYQTFLNSIKAYDGTMVLEWRNNVTMYEQEPKINEDVEGQQKEEKPTEEDEIKAIETEESEEQDAICLIQMEEASFDNSLESEEQSYFREILQHKPSLFRTELLSLLSKPFDQKEYENLKLLINVRKPVVKYKHLRDESVSYSSKKLGSSYLDHYPDLAKRIESTMDDRKKDLLLRGFFFWLKNLSYQEAFRPWIPPLLDHIVIDPFEDEMVLPLQIDLSGRKEVQTGEERMINNANNKEEEGKMIEM